METQPRFEMQSNRRAVFVLLSQATVTPVREPYYTFRKKDDGTDVATLTRRGGNISDALAKVSDFLKVVEGIDRKREYVFLVVDPASFETFRTIRGNFADATSTAVGIPPTP